MRRGVPAVLTPSAAPTRGRRPRHHTPVGLAAGTAVAGVVLTVAVVSSPALPFAYQAPTVQVMLETVNAVVALLVGFLLYGRFRQSRRVQELLLALALGALAVANLVLTALPSAVAGGGDAAGPWAALGARLLGTALLALAALVPRGLLLGRRGTGVVVLVFGAVLLGVTAAGMWGTGDLPTATTVTGLPAAAGPRLTAHPLVVAAQSLGALGYALAAVALVRQSQSRSAADELLRWLAAGFVLAAFARVHYVLFPSLYSDYVYTGDLLRLGAYLLMLTGAVREIQSFWRLQTEAAVEQDRRRMARDLHDGLTQELAYIHGQARQLARRPADTVTVQRIGSAADRAIDEARRAIAALTQPAHEPFPHVLGGLLESMAVRYDVEVVPSVDPDVQVTDAQAEALLRITAEAVRNAARHGGASRVTVTLRLDPLRLTVSDDGRGFDVPGGTGERATGFGLTSMRERAAGLGAELSIDSTPGKGTTVQVRRP